MRTSRDARRFGYGTKANSFVNPKPSDQSLDPSRASVFRTSSFIEFEVGASGCVNSTVRLLKAG